MVVLQSKGWLGKWDALCKVPGKSARDTESQNNAELFLLSTLLIDLAAFQNRKIFGGKDTMLDLTMFDLA